MSALPLTLTTAGRAALINAQNTGVSNVVITEMGLSNVQVALSAATVAIPGEFKRVAGVGGQVVAPETFYVAATDTSTDTYSVRTIALYLSNGVLLGAYSQAAVLLEKAEPAMAVIEASVRLAEPLAVEIEFTGGGWNNPPASETVEGIVRLATWAEVQAGTNDKRPVTPKWLKALLEGFSTTNHTHDASAVVSGIFAVARIPDLAMARITGLVDALAAKAAAAHTHAMADIVGLTAALGLKLDGALFTWANLPGKPAVAISNTDVVFNSVQTVVSGTPARGRLYFGDQTGGSRTLIYDGVAYYFSGADLYANGSKVWTAATFDPATKANAAHTQDWSTVTGKPATLVYTDTVQVFTGRKVFKGAGVGTLAAQGWETSAVEVQSTSATDAAVMTFHLPGGVVFKFGLDTDYQWKAVNSAGGVATFWHSANFDPTTKVSNLQASITARGTAGFGSASLVGGDANNSGFTAFYLPDGTRVGYIGAASATGKAIVFASENGGSFFFGARPSFNGGVPWDSNNFNPAGKISQSTGPTVISGGTYGLNVATVAGSGAGGGGWSRFNSFTGGSADTNGVVYGAFGDGAVGGYAYIGVGDAASRYASTDTLRVYATYAAWGDQPLWHDGNARSTAAAFRGNADNRALTPNNVWSAAALVAAAQAATIAVDLSAGLNFSTTMTGNRTLGAPANAKPGQSGVIQIIQDATGGRTLGFNAAWKFEGGTVPTLSTAANARDVLVFTVIAAGDVVASLLKDVRR